jgi:DNA-directed RNA polymerase subunit RPC12/RpoP
MSLSKACPGAKFIREASPEYIECPRCGGELELWSDEPFARCPHCRAVVPRKIGASCIDWCAHAAECVGVEALRKLKENPPA